MVDDGTQRASEIALIADRELGVSIASEDGAGGRRGGLSPELACRWGLLLLFACSSSTSNDNDDLSLRLRPTMDASFTTSSYFQTQDPPRNLADEQARTVAFLQRAKAQRKRVALVTVSSDGELAMVSSRRPAAVPSFADDSLPMMMRSFAERWDERALGEEHVRSSCGRRPS